MIAQINPNGGAPHQLGHPWMPEVKSVSDNFIMTKAKRVVVKGIVDFLDRGTLLAVNYMSGQL